MHPHRSAHSTPASMPGFGMAAASTSTSPRGSAPTLRSVESPLQATALSLKCFESGQWGKKEHRHPALNNYGAELRLMTFNVWFGDLEQPARNRALLEEIQRLKPDVCALQEVSAPFFVELLRNAFICEHYAVTHTSTLDSFRMFYGSILLIRRDLEAHAFYADFPNTRQGRQLVWLRFPYNDELMIVATAHLESTRPQIERRCEQLHMVVQLLQTQGVKHAFFMGDNNFDVRGETGALSKEETVVLSYNAVMRDVWTLCNPMDMGYTEDGELNKLLALTRPEKRTVKVRFDRIFYLCFDPRLWDRFTHRSMELLGTQPLLGKPQIHISDHFGLIARFEVAKRVAP